jgi:ESCRT-II complex subunit VPS36
MLSLVAGEGCGPGITSSDVARSMAIPLTIAQQHLLMAESVGVLCRDDGPEGLKFFRNFFKDVGAVGLVN